MKRFHVNLNVSNLNQSVEFYTTIFGAEPTVLKPDYAKWMLEDPRINFAISSASAAQGVEHFGIQAEDEKELHAIYVNFRKAKGTMVEEGKTICCYAKSEKAWITDPQGIEWEAFYTTGESNYYGEGKKENHICCP